MGFQNHKFRIPRPHQKLISKTHPRRNLHSVSYFNCTLMVSFFFSISCCASVADVCRFLTFYHFASSDRCPWVRPSFRGVLAPLIPPGTAPAPPPTLGHPFQKHREGVVKRASKKVKPWNGFVKRASEGQERGKVSLMGSR